MRADDTGDRPKYRVELAVDPGYANYAIIAIQRTRNRAGAESVRVIDEVWGHGKTTEELIYECRTRPWWKNIIPSAAGVMDVASKQHHGDRSVREVWTAEAGFKFKMRHVKIEDGNDRLSSFLEDMALKSSKDDKGVLRWSEPEQWTRLFIDNRCRNLIEEFTEYKYQEGPVSGRRVPIDEYNHGIKALAYFLVDRFGYSRRRKNRIVEFRMVA
jgi:hypothetical protein